jgi:hypothetical protein
MRKRWLLLGAITLALTIPLVVLLWEFARDYILVETMRLVWRARVVLGSVPQMPVWLGMVAIVLFIGAQALLVGQKLPRREERVTIDRRSDVAALAWRIRRAPQGQYYRWDLARYISDLLAEAIAHQERLSPDQVRRKLKRGETDAPEEVHRYFQRGLAPFRSIPRRPVQRLREWLSLSNPTDPGTPDPELLPVIEYLEELLEVRYDQ